MESKELAIRLARALDAKKGYNIRILHVENLTTVTDYFVIATGNSTTMWAHWQTRRTSSWAAQA
mgnify:FL=1